MLLNCGVGEDTMDCKEIQPVHPKGNQSWIFIGRTDAKAETPILWPLDVKNWLIGKDPDAGKDWRQEEKGWQRMASPTQWTWVWISSRSWWWTRKPGVLQSWDHKESDTTEQLNWTELNRTQNLSSVYSVFCHVSNYSSSQSGVHLSSPQCCPLPAHNRFLHPPLCSPCHSDMDPHQGPWLPLYLSWGLCSFLNRCDLIDCLFKSVYSDDKSKIIMTSGLLPTRKEMCIYIYKHIYIYILKILFSILNTVVCAIQ